MEEKKITFEDIQKANETIITTDIKGKEYAEVNQRIKAFRMVYPNGCIKTEMKSNVDGVCIFNAYVYEYYNQQTGPMFSNNISSKLLATGTAYEKENSTFINKTSYIENCETSAIGRALGIAGFGIDTSVASADEVRNAMNNQEPTKEDAEKYVITFGKYKDKKLSEVIKDSWYKNYLLNGNDEYIKKCIELLTGEKPLTKEEQDEIFDLMGVLSDLLDETNTDREKFYKYYGVTSNSEMTLEQLRDAVTKLNEKKVSK